MRKKKRKPDAAAAKFAIGIGVFCLAAVIFASKLDLGQICFGAATAIMAFSWGSQELAAAKKWKQEGKGDEAPAYRIVIPKTILLVVLGILLFVLAFVVRFVWFKP